MQRNPGEPRRPDAPRQWGADRRTEPHPLVPPPVSEGRIARGRLAIVLTITVWACYIAYTIFEQFVVGKAAKVAPRKEMRFLHERKADVRMPFQEGGKRRRAAARRSDDEGEPLEIPHAYHRPTLAPDCPNGSSR